jgi:murein DD-endopeptidase MepM/ murein hydrolase activator NlpD
MKKDKYYYNPNTLKYEKLKKTKTEIALRVLGFLGTSFAIAVIIVLISFSLLQSPREKMLQLEVEMMADEFKAMQQKVNVLADILGQLENRDDNIYRVIFESEPVSKDIRKMGVGGIDRYAYLDRLSEKDLMKSTAERLDVLERRMYVQSKSFDELAKMIKEKESLLSAIPAILPVKQKSNVWFSSGYGIRIDPIYKSPKMHRGVDFSAPIGTEIYATADGKIAFAGVGSDGYGRKVVINHGFGYQTLYAHMSRVAVKKGQTIKRGQLIGFVGNTGKSTAPHLHYEVIKNNYAVNPVNFFHGDLSPEEYEKFVLIANSSNQSFD